MVRYAMLTAPYFYNLFNPHSEIKYLVHFHYSLLITHYSLLIIVRCRAPLALTLLIIVRCRAPLALTLLIIVRLRAPLR